ncbi:RNA-directed DNA polymerase [Rhodococcus sp. 1.20]
MHRSVLLDELDLATAVTAELEYTTLLLPPLAVTGVLTFRSEQVTNLVRSALDQDVTATPASVVLASKTKGVRPLNQWRLQDRVFYSALVERLRLQLPNELQKRRSHAKFEAAPYANDVNEYICSTDITAYYQYIDHDVLADELIAQTGDFHAVTALTGLLEQIMGTRVGIPQVHDASDVLGDTYVDPIRRALIRAGYDTYVFADDFRIGCSSLGQARAALELCTNAARELGLVLNDAKTYTYKRETYLGTMNRLSTAESTLLEEMNLKVAADFLFPREYADRDKASPLEPDFSHIDGAVPGMDGEESVDDPRIDERNSDLVRAVWAAWENNTEARTHQTVRHLLGQALPALGTLGDEGPLSQVPNLLDTAPHLTPKIAAYLKNLDADDVLHSNRVDNLIYTLVRSDRLSEWQKLWLAYVLGSPKAAHPFEPAPDPRPPLIIEWLNDCVQSEHDALAAAAADSLGRLNVGDTDILTAAYGRVAPEYRLPILWALGKLDPDKAHKVAEGKYHRLVLPPVLS